jgi:hypothetical protein
MTRFRTTAALALAGWLAGGTLAACSKAPEPTSIADDDAAEIRELRQRIAELEQKSKAPSTAGLESLDLGRRLSLLDQRLRTIEEKQGVAPPAEPVAPPDAPTASNGSASPPVFLPADGSTSFSEEQIGTFRKLWEVAEKRRQEEQQVERVRTQLQRLQAGLSADQEKAVVDLTIAYQQKQREMFRGGFGATEEDRKERTDKMTALRTEWETEVRNILPQSAADKIVEGIGRGFGFGGGPRRIDGTNLGGMRNE